MPIARHSGAQYAGVTDILALRPLGGINVDAPKSHSLIVMCGSTAVMRMFSGLTSRCAIPASCTNLRALAIWSYTDCYGQHDQSRGDEHSTWRATLRCCVTVLLTMAVKRSPYCDNGKQIVLSVKWHECGIMT